MKPEEELIVRLVEVTGEKPETTAMAGLTLRRGLEQDDLHLTLTGSRDGGWYVANADEGDSQFMQMPFSVPVWMRIVRAGPRASAYWSSDGDRWTLAGSMILGNDDELLVGFVALALNQRHSVTAVFNNIQLRTGRAAFVAHRSGLQLTNGSVIYGEVEAEGPLFTIRAVDETEHRIAGDRVARVIYAPLPSRLIAELSAGWRGAIMENDHIAGEVTSISGRSVTVNSLIFGIRTVTPRQRLRAAILNDVRISPGATIIHHLGGRYVVMNPQIQDDMLVAHDPGFGAVRLPLDQIISIDLHR